MPNTAGTAIVPLSQGFGYGIILGLGSAFAIGMIGTTWALKRYHGEVYMLPLGLKNSILTCYIGANL